MLWSACHDPQWLKLGDIELNQEIKKKINTLMIYYLGDTPMVGVLQARFWNKYRYRYLWVNDYQVWIQSFTEKLEEIELEAALRIQGFFKINTDWIAYNHSLTTTNTTTGGNKHTLTDTRSYKEKVVDRSVKNDVNKRTGTQATQGNSNNNVTVNQSVKYTGSDSVKTTHDGTTDSSNTTNTLDQPITTTTNDLQSERIGVETVNAVPAADTVTKTISASLVPPMNAASSLTAQGTGEGDQKIFADNIVPGSTPFDVSGTEKVSGAAENITYTNLQREANGNYKANITTTTYGEINSESGLYEGIKDKNTGTSTVSISPPQGEKYTQIVGADGSTTISDTTNATTTYNSTDTTTGTNHTEATATDTITYNVTDSRAISGGDDEDTNNLQKMVQYGGGTITDISNTGSTQGKATGYTIPQSELYVKFIDAIEKSPVTRWFTRKMEDLFSCSLEMDQREITEVKEVSI